MVSYNDKCNYSLEIVHTSVGSGWWYGGPMKESEYGGADTVKTGGIQPPPHVLTAEEKLRLLYRTDAADPESGGDIVGDVGKA